jgi:hypothetical protein
MREIGVSARVRENNTSFGLLLSRTEADKHARSVPKAFVLFFSLTRLDDQEVLATLLAVHLSDTSEQEARNGVLRKLSCDSKAK